MWGISITLRGVEALSKSEINQAVRNAMEAMGQEWRDKYAHKRFTKAGAREYGFRWRDGESNPRIKGSYTNRKLRLFGHTLPLVYTGQLRQQTLYEVKTVKGSADSRGAKVRIQLPRKANFHLKEMQAVSAAEIQYLQHFLAGRLHVELQKLGAMRTRTYVSIGAGASGLSAAA